MSGLLAGLVLAGVHAAALAGGAGAPLWVGRFTAEAGGVPAPWEVERLNKDVPATRYRVREWDGVNAVEALADRSMALLARPIEVDLEATPVLCWRWRVDAPVAAADMARKSGDDYAARVYLAFDVAPDALALATRLKLALARSVYGDAVPDAAVNYVWDNRNPVGTMRDNAYTDRARMLVLRSGAAQAGRWVTERRDVRADFRRAFGEVPAKLRGLALATDTDNTGAQARAGYADFHFVAGEAQCWATAGGPTEVSAR